MAPLPSCSGTRMSESLCRCTFYLRLKLLATKLHLLYQITKSVFGRLLANYAEEQILRFYRVPEPDTPIQFIKFRYSAEILEKIGVNPALRQNLNNQNIGNVMKRLGFKKIHKKNGNGWAVIEKEGSEINNDAFIDPNDTVED